MTALPLQTAVRQRPDLRGLAERVRSVEEGRCGSGRGREQRAAPGLDLGWGGVGPGPVLVRGAAHEFFSGWWAEPAGRQWVAPVAVLADVAWRALRAAPSGDSGGPGLVVWIGRRCWPHPVVMVRPGGVPGTSGRALLERSILIEAPDVAARVWAIDLAARSPATVLVIADGSGLDMSATRRVQLAAEAGAATAPGGVGGLVLLGRPERELRELSASATRWLVRPEPSETGWPRWGVRLMRAKGRGLGRAAQVVTEETRSWVLEPDRAASCLRVPSDVAGGPGAAAGPAGRGADAGARRRAV
ncbi:MAG TPA: hypothetical protein VD963_06875 [Phycisphaerales bacterium]|nr:hypothetical protein [Phycisphaerales bacterium]